MMMISWTARFKKKTKLLNTKCVFWFSVQLLSETFLILRRNERDMIKNVFWSSRKVTVILVRFSWNLNFLNIFSKNNTQIPNFTKIRPVGAELFHADRHDKANSVFRTSAKAPNQKGYKKGNGKLLDCDRLRCSGLGLILKVLGFVHCYREFKTDINPCNNTGTYIPTPNDPLSAETILKKEEEALCNNVRV